MAAEAPPDPRLDPGCRKISERGLFQVAENNQGRGLLVHKKTGERHVVFDFRDIHVHEDRAFVRLRNGDKRWLDKIFSWALWSVTESEKEFVIKTGENGNTIVWLADFLKKRLILHPRAGGDSRQHLVKRLSKWV
ncbi:unnamed protein product [Symbiodinium sp. CCMP2592]|nr:unnamed protein product [Symbiodinium sp. CCMP2592]